MSSDSVKRFPGLRELALCGLAVLVLLYGIGSFDGEDDEFHGGSGPWGVVGGTQRKAIKDLLRPPSVAVRLVTELELADAVPSRKEMIQRARSKAREIERASLGGDRERILDLVAGDGVEERAVLAELLDMITAPSYSDEQTDQRAQAARQISLFPSERGLLALIEVLDRPYESSVLRRSVASALRVFDDERTRSALRRFEEEDPGRSSSTPRRPAGASSTPVPRELASASRDVRRRAIEDLAARSDDEATEALIAALEDPDPELRAVAVRALARRSSTRAEAAITRLLGRERARQPIYAAATTFERCNPEVLAGLLSAYENAPDSRDIILSALPRCDYARAVGPILDALRFGDGALEFSASVAMKSLPAQGNQTAIRPLIAALGDERDPKVIEIITSVLTRLTGKNYGKDPEAWMTWWRNDFGDSDVTR